MIYFKIYRVFKNYRKIDILSILKRDRQVSSLTIDLNFSGGGPDPNARPFTSHKSQMLRQQAMLSQNGLLPESLIWTYVIQMTSSLRHIHSAGLACRTLDPTKILIINKTRLLLNCCGIFDVLTYDPTSSNPMAAMAHYQQEDLIALGKIVLGRKKSRRLNQNSSSNEMVGSLCNDSGNVTHFLPGNSNLGRCHSRISDTT